MLAPEEIPTRAMAVTVAPAGTDGIAITAVRAEALAGRSDSVRAARRPTRTRS